MLPIVQRNNKTFKLIGTCLYILVDKVAYLVTAAHVFEHSIESERCVHTHNKLVSLHGPLRSTAAIKANRGEDRYDFAFYEIPTDDLTSFRRKTPFVLDNVASHVQSGTDRDFVIYGFPISKNKKAFAKSPGAAKYSPALYCGNGYQPDRELVSRLSLRQEHHILVESGADIVDGSDRTTNIPKYNGMSGGGVFSLGPSSDPQSTGRYGKLVGMLIEHHEKDRVLVAVRFDFIFRSVQKSTDANG